MQHSPRLETLNLLQPILLTSVRRVPTRNKTLFHIFVNINVDLKDWGFAPQVKRND